MTNTILRNIILGLSLTAVGCATAPALIVAPALPELQPVKPSYEEKTGSMTLDKIKATCPADSKWEEYDWKRIPPFANACVKAKDWSKVEKMGNNLATRAYLTPWGPYYLAVAAEGRKDYPRAIWMLELALKKAPKEGLFHYELARIHWDLGDDADAVKHMKSASELSPNLTEAHATMGELALGRHEYSEAEGYFQKALNNDDKHLPALLGMAMVTMNNKDYARAEGFLARAVSSNPHSSKARLALAEVQEEHLKKYQEALSTYKELKRMNADKKLDESVHINLDEKIQSLEKSLSQAAAKPKSGELTVRTPSNERKVQ
jgi:tetratricopeptide (TPR) repeat protein